MSQLGRWARRGPSLVCFGCFVLLWLPLQLLPERLPRPLVWALWPYAALTLGLLVLADRLDRLLVPEAYRPLRGNEAEVPYP